MSSLSCGCRTIVIGVAGQTFGGYFWMNADRSFNIALTLVSACMRADPRVLEKAEGCLGS
jgi:hypothetical protein